MNRIFQRVTCNLHGKVRRKKFHGRMHVVVPMVMIPEGVLDGSRGPGLYLNEELEKTPILWNNKPIVLNHPEDGTADDIQVLEESKLGFVLNARVRNKKLGGEAWLDEKRTNAIAPAIIKYLDEGKSVELSSGLNLDQEIKNGTYKRTGTKYKWIARNHQPDHLAIFDPTSGKVGAASVRMGAGLNVKNAASKDTRRSFRKMIEAAVKNLGGTITKNELSFSQRQYSLCEQLSAKYGEPGKYWRGYIIDLYDAFVIFYDGDNYMKIGYTETDNAVTLNGEAVQVERTVQYVTVNGLRFVANESSLIPEEENDMAKTATFKKKEFLDGLITNGGYEETDREWLEKLDDKALAKIRPVANQVEEDTELEDEEDEDVELPVTNKGKKGKVLVTNDAGGKGSKASLDLEESLKTLHPDVRRMVKRTLNRENQEKDKLVKWLTKNSKLNPKYLAKQDIDDLKALAITLNKKNKRRDEDEEDDESMFSNNVENEDEEEDEGEEEGYDQDALMFAGVGAPVNNNRRRRQDEGDAEGPGLAVPTLNFSRPDDRKASKVG